jgi:hypothetical protein
LFIEWVSSDEMIVGLGGINLMSESGDAHRRVLEGVGVNVGDCDCEKLNCEGMIWNFCYTLKLDFLGVSPET